MSHSHLQQTAKKIWNTSNTKQCFFLKNSCFLKLLTLSPIRLILPHAPDWRSAKHPQKHRANKMENQNHWRDIPALVGSLQLFESFATKLTWNPSPPSEIDNGLTTIIDVTLHHRRVWLEPLKVRRQFNGNILLYAKGIKRISLGNVDSTWITAQLYQMKQCLLKYCYRSTISWRTTCKSRKKSCRADCLNPNSNPATPENIEMHFNLSDPLACRKISTGNDVPDMQHLQRLGKHLVYLLVGNPTR